MINHRISVDWSTTKPIAAFSCTRRVQEVHTKAEVVNITPGLLGFDVLYIVTHRKGIAAVWSTTKPIAAFSCIPRLQEVNIKAEVVHLTPGLLVLCSSHA